MAEHSQETKIAILEEKVEHMMGHVKELTLRVRANEKVVASVSLLGVIACTFIGAGYFAPKADASEAVVPSYNQGDRVIVVQSDPIPGTPLGVSRSEYPEYLEPRGPSPYPGMLPDTASSANEIINRFRQWEAEQKRTDPEFDINNALAEYFNNGGDDTTEQEELLQFQSDGDQQSIGWRYD